MTTPYDGDKFTGLRPWSDDEHDGPPRRSYYDEPCQWCDDGSLPVGTMPNTFGCVPACGSCIMAFEEDDAPEELAITLGDKTDEAPSLCKPPHLDYCCLLCSRAGPDVRRVSHPVTGRSLYFCPPCLDDVCLGRVPSPR
jgi:hypothetical protein